MAFKSLAQKEKYAKMLADGMITQQHYLKMLDGTPDNLPDRVEPRAKKNPAVVRATKAGKKR